jgi:hypothetical protein
MAWFKILPRRNHSTEDVHALPAPEPVPITPLEAKAKASMQRIMAIINEQKVRKTRQKLNLRLKIVLSDSKGTKILNNLLSFSHMYTAFIAQWQRCRPIPQVPGFESRSND